MNAKVFNIVRTKKTLRWNLSRSTFWNPTELPNNEPTFYGFFLANILNIFWFRRAKFFNPTSETLIWNWSSRKFSQFLVPASQNCPICCHIYSIFSNFSATQAQCEQQKNQCCDWRVQRNQKNLYVEATESMKNCSICKDFANWY